MTNEQRGVLPTYQVEGAAIDYSARLVCPDDGMAGPGIWRMCRAWAARAGNRSGTNRCTAAVTA